MTNATKTYYKVNGWKMKENAKTWEMERDVFVTDLIVFSTQKNIDTFEDRESFECEISRQLQCDWFELDSFGYK